MQEDKGHDCALIVSRFLWPGVNRNRNRKAAAYSGSPVYLFFKKSCHPDPEWNEGEESAVLFSRAEMMGCRGKTADPLLHSGENMLVLSIYRRTG